MKLGIIIICHNNESEIDIDHCVQLLHKLTDFKICLVNNNSQDRTFEMLNEIKERCDNISIVDMKKYKSGNSSIKAGARFMLSQYNLQHIGFIETEKINLYQNLSDLFKDIKQHKVDISNYNQRPYNSKGIKLTMFQSLFCVIDYLIKGNLEPQ